MAGILRVGLTGGIACGRSTAARHLLRPGWLLIDADLIVHGLLAEGGSAAGAVIEAFGSQVCAPGGGVDRKALGAIVFSDEESRRRLEAIVHPLVYEVIERDMASFERRAGSGIVLIDAALMVETGSYRNYHRLVVVHCPPSDQIRRLMRRDRVPEEVARRRIGAQWPIEKKIAVADYTLDTGGTEEETRLRAQALAGLLEEDQRRLPDLPVRRKGRDPS